MNTPDVLMCLRRQAWQRAKGELQAVLETYFNGTEGPQFQDVSDKIEAFQVDIESNW